MRQHIVVIETDKDSGWLEAALAGLQNNLNDSRHRGPGFQPPIGGIMVSHNYHLIDEVRPIFERDGCFVGRIP